MSEEEYLPLNELNEGESGEIMHYTDVNQSSRRLAEMGLIPGKSVQYIRSAPLKDPIQVRVGESDLSLRKAEAEKIHVKRKKE